MTQARGVFRMILSKEQIESIVREVMAPANLARKKREFDLYEGSEGGLKPYVRKRVLEIYPKTGHNYSIVDYSITKKAVTKKAKAYKEAPIRKVSLDSNSAQNDVLSKAYNDIAKKFDLNSAMREFDRAFNRHRYALMSIMMEEPEATGLPLKEAPKPTFSFVPLAPHEFDVILSDKGMLDVVILSYSAAEVRSGALESIGLDSAIAADGGAKEGSDQHFFVIWTETNHYVVKFSEDKATGELRKAGATRPNRSTIEILKMKDNPGNENPWGVLPFAYGPYTGKSNYPKTNPIGEQAIELGAALSIYMTSGSMQTGQLVLEHPSDQPIETVAQGLFSLIKLPQSKNPEDKPTKATFINPSPDMAGHRESIMTFFSLILDEQGIGVSGKVGSSEDFASGFDRLLANVDVEDVIEENQETYQRVEAQIFKVVSKQLSTLGMNGVPPEATLTTIYRRPKMLMTDSENLDNIEKMERLGMIEPWEKHILFDPNLTEEEAKAKEERIQKAKAEMAPPPGDPNAVDENGDPISPDAPKGKPPFPPKKKIPGDKANASRARPNDKNG